MNGTVLRCGNLMWGLPSATGCLPLVVQRLPGSRVMLVLLLADATWAQAVTACFERRNVSKRLDV